MIESEKQISDKLRPRKPVAVPGPSMAPQRSQSPKIQVQNNDLLNAINQIRDDLNFQYNQLDKKVSSLLESKAEVTEELKYMDDKINNANNEIEILKYEVNSFKQKELQNDVIVSGLPATTNSTNYVINKLASLYKFNKDDVLFSTLRKNHNQEETHNLVSTVALLIRFKNSACKSVLMANRYKLGPVDQNFNFIGTIRSPENNKQMPIFINDRLTAYNLEIMRELTQLRKKKLIWSSRYRFGIIYVNKSKESREIIIKTMNDVKILTADPTNSPYLAETSSTTIMEHVTTNITE